MPEHELRPETGVGAGVDPAGTSEEPDQVRSPATESIERDVDADIGEIPPVSRSG